MMFSNLIFIENCFEHVIIALRNRSSLFLKLSA